MRRNTPSELQLPLWLSLIRGGLALIRLAKLLIGGFLCFSMVSVTAQTSTVWVTDQLQLGLHKNPDTSGSAMRVLQSGTELQVLERNRFYARVRTTDGVVGWVKAGYLISNKPAAARAIELETENNSLSEKLEETQTGLEETNAQLSRVRSEANTLATKASENSGSLTTLQTENEEFRSRLKAYKGSLPLSWVTLSLLLMLAAGFVSGLKWEDHQSRKRHGGIRVR